MGLVKRGHEVTVYSPSYHPKDDQLSSGLM